MPGGCKNLRGLESAWTHMRIASCIVEDTKPAGRRDPRLNAASIHFSIIRKSSFGMSACMCFAMHGSSAATHSQKAEFEGGENETGENECQSWKKKETFETFFFDT